MRAPTQEFENASDLDTIYMSRENYERLLRRLVRNSSGRIRWLAGTATGLQVTSDHSNIGSVLVRTDGGFEKAIPAVLVIGGCGPLQWLGYLSRPFFADCAGPSQVGLKWLKRVYETEAVSARPGSLPFEDLRLEYKTVGRYTAFRFHVPIASCARLPIPGGYNKAGAIFYYMPKTGTKRCNFVMNRIEGHRSMHYLYQAWAHDTDA